MEIVLVEGKRLTKAFIDFPHDLYAGDPNYVPELYIAQKETLSKTKNPFFQHSEADLFLAYRDGKIVGRIAAIHNRNYNDYAKTNVGFFGFFDVIDDYQVAEFLLNHASNWIKERGLTAVLGPTNFTTNDVSGLLTEGFDSPPWVMMTYNKAYYVDFLKRYGFESEIDLFAYHLLSSTINQKALKLSERIEERLANRGIAVRSVNMKNFDQEVAAILEVYNKAWEVNEGFVPATKSEFEHLAEGLKMVVNPDYVQIAEHDGKAIGFILAVPDVNTIVRKIKRGRLFPFGFIRLLLGLKKIKRFRVITLGVVEGYRKMGIEGVLYGSIIRNGFRNGIVEAEASWILANNTMMNKALENMNARIHKKYCILKKAL